MTSFLSCSTIVLFSCFSIALANLWKTILFLVSARLACYWRQPLFTDAFTWAAHTTFRFPHKNIFSALNYSDELSNLARSSLLSATKTAATAENVVNPKLSLSCRTSESSTAVLCKSPSNTILALVILSVAYKDFITRIDATLAAITAMSLSSTTLTNNSSTTPSVQDLSTHFWQSHFFSRTTSTSSPRWQLPYKPY